MKFYSIGFKDSEALGVGYSSEDVLEVNARFNGDREVENWQRVVFELRDGGHSDYQANDLGVRLCSPRLAAILTSTKLEEERFQWLAATVGGREYHILHLPQTPDVLSKEGTVFHKGLVVRPVLRKTATGGVFKCRPGDVLQLIVSERVRDALLKAKCIGLDYEVMPQL